MEHLEILELPETSLTSQGAEQFSEMKNLRHLFLGGVEITAEQAEALRKKLPQCQVSWWKKPAISTPETGRRGGG
jgi:hypothetical protein